MVEILAPSAADLMSRYRDKWLKIGLCTDPVDGGLARELTDYYYRHLFKKRPVPLEFAPSPLAAWRIVMQASGTITDQLGWKAVDPFAWWAPMDKIGYLNGMRVEPVWTLVEGELRRIMHTELAPEISREVREGIGHQVRWFARAMAQIWRQAELQDKDFCWPFLNGQFAGYYFADYDYLHQVLKIPFRFERQYHWCLKTTGVGLVYPLEKICVISDRPASIAAKNGVLHSDSGPAVRYRDGFSVWCLHGVIVPKTLVQTPAADLDPAMLLTERNAEVRKEIIGKIGIERVCRRLNAKPLDRKGEMYELLNLDLGDRRRRPYLKMLNPSTGACHLEGVPPQTATVDEALAWRNQTKEKPTILS